MSADAEDPGIVPAAHPARTAPLSLRFANTRYAVRGQARDGIGTPELLRDWLTRHAGELGLSGPPAVDADADVVPFVELRDAIRELVADAMSDPGDERAAAGGGGADAVALLNQLSAGGPSWPALVRSGRGLRVVWHTERTAQPAALTTLAQDAIAMLGGAVVGDLRACRAPGCVQIFVKDHPRREFCSTACGNRARAARHYLRHRED
ncbi:CGNR zinc finger domain-containing protein [Dactylosporangium sp. NPDC051484]|uniref:CGNR zinc finger domain-containing protein n=1 Tax=Dactylosporangium sp. NPDC051484 TaxID=3154942 RepID=UPI00344ECC75